MPPLPFGPVASFATTPSTTNTNHSVTIVLKSKTSTDSRTLTLFSGCARLIGRASRTKIKDLKEAQDNALFDCPVVSRQHAELRATTIWPSPEHQITVTDCSSMHGTYVNGIRLLPGVPHPLRLGDVIKLGERVTQGEHVHEGVSLTFTFPSSFPQLPTTLSTTTTALIQRGFRAPSVSDDSDFASDNNSVVSDQEEEDVSAHTTPEELKMKPGSQQAPIELDAGSASPTDSVTRAVSSKIINLDGEDSESDDDFSVPQSHVGGVVSVMPPSGQKIAAEGTDQPASENEDEDAQSELASEANMGPMAELSDEELADMGRFALRPLDEVDEVDGFEYEENDGFDDEEDDGFGDGFSDSGSDQQSDDEEQDREPSPELGISFDENEPADRTETTTFVPMVPQSQPAAAAPQKPRYDPVRSSQPPEEANNGPFKSKTYTYGYQDDGRVANLATDFDHSSRFDIGPTGLYEPLAHLDQNQDHILLDPFGVRDHTAYEQGAMDAFQSAPQLNFTTEFEFPSGFGGRVAQPVEGPARTIKNRISIEDIVDNVDFSVPQSTVMADSSTSATVSNANKRKADEMTAGESQGIEPPTKKHTQAHVVPKTGDAVIARTSATRAKLNKRRMIQRAALTAGKVVGCAALGTVGSIALLSSPSLVSPLISWLA